MADLTPEVLEELRELLSEGTPGPWRGVPRGGCAEIVATADQRLDLDIASVWSGHHDQAIIVAAVNALPALLRMAEETERVREENVRLASELARYKSLSEAVHLHDECRAENTRLWGAVESAREAVARVGSALAQLAANGHLPFGQDPRRWWDDAVTALDEADTALVECGDRPTSGNPANRQPDVKP